MVDNVHEEQSYGKCHRDNYNLSKSRFGGNPPSPRLRRMKGEKFQDDDVDFEDILINISYLIRFLATGMRGKPHLKQEQTLAARQEGT